MFIWIAYRPMVHRLKTLTWNVHDLCTSRYVEIKSPFKMTVLTWCNDPTTIRTSFKKKSSLWPVLLQISALRENSKAGSSARPIRFSALPGHNVACQAQAWSDMYRRPPMLLHVDALKRHTISCHHCRTMHGAARGGGRPISFALQIGV